MKCNKTNLYWIAILILGLSSCKSKFEFIGLENFNIDSSALSNKANVKVLYCSGLPDDNKPQDYYYHFVVLANNNQDTINILAANIDASEDIVTDLTFIARGSAEYKIFRNSDALESKEGTIDLDEFKFEDYKKVILNKKYAFIALNNYRTVIGELVKSK